MKPTETGPGPGAASRLTWVARASYAVETALEPGDLLTYTVVDRGTVTWELTATSELRAGALGERVAGAIRWAGLGDPGTARVDPLPQVAGVALLGRGSVPLTQLWRVTLCLDMPAGVADRGVDRGAES